MGHRWFVYKRERGKKKGAMWEGLGRSIDVGKKAISSVKE